MCTGVESAHLQPERGTLADSRELSGLEVSESQRGQVAVLFGEGGKAVDDDREFLEEKGKGFAEEDQVCVAEKR